MSEIHPFYQAHRATMESALRQRLDLADGLMRKRLGLADPEPLKHEIMEEFEIVLHQMPYVGGAESRMTDFFMRLIGFMAIGRVMRRHGVALQTINEIGAKVSRRSYLPSPRPTAW